MYARYYGNTSDVHMMLIVLSKITHWYWQINNTNKLNSESHYQCEKGKESVVLRIATCIHTYAL